MKYILIMVLLAICTSIYATPNAALLTGAKYDDKHKLIPPDQVYLARGLKDYKTDYNQSAFTMFKKSAAFGNTQAQFLLGLMHIKSLGVEQSWAKGYAWIKLAALDETKKHVEFRDALFRQLKPDERSQSEIEYNKILKDYDPSIALWRRDRWTTKQKIKTVGSHLGSVGNVTSYYSLKDIDKKAGGDPNTSEGFLNEFEAFVNDYNFGHVISSEILPKDDSNAKVE